MYGRYIDNELLAALSRPQYPHGCSVACLTTAVNFLFGSKTGFRTQEQVSQVLGFAAGNIGIEGGPGNETLLEWFRKYTSSEGLEASCGILLDRYDAKDESLSSNIFEELKGIIENRDTVLIYHLEYHYNLVCGYVEHAPGAACAYGISESPQRWLVLADTSPKRNPVWSVQWEAMLEDFCVDRRHCILAFSRASEDGEPQGI